MEQAAPDSAEHRLTVTQIRRKRLIRVCVHLGIGGLFTGWWIAGLILHRNDKNWIVPFLVWLAVISRLLLWHIPSVRLVRPLARLWERAITRPANVVPPKWTLIGSWILLIGLIATVAMVAPDFQDNTTVNRGVSLAGLAVMLALLWLTSRNRRKISWYTVLCGLYLQYIVALFVLRTSVGYNIFTFLSDRASDLLGFADEGLAFLTDSSVPELSWFVISVVPPIIFFAGIAQLLTYWGALQWLVTKAATFFYWALKVSGAEAVVAASSPFFGQGESVMLIRPFLNDLTHAELHQVMCSGFATIAGSVLVAYISLGVNGTALISSCVMSIPASIVVSKLRYPETEETLTAEKLTLTPEDNKAEASNWMHAFTNGCWLGFKLAGIVVAVLGSVIALVDLCDALLTWFGSYLNIEELTLEIIFGYALVPVAFLLGVPRDHDIVLVSRLIAVKILRNEFIAYEELQTSPAYIPLSPRSRLIATYSLCGFGNLGSLGTQVGLMTQMAPRRNKDIASVAFSAFITGVISTLTSAGMAGMLLGEQSAMSLLQPTTSSPAATATSPSA
ncbi:hypothetical protein M406DRAFT_327969 [Cryphonectria parasitica EP155]|uniref:Uncharacterized protein n=1 Tax=Cryphonectria parasitica (strain ATCC 38755 / EP155) TaxID=660469 RepID=A0A9P4Y5E0_CRYP1|nr:uncharacterized protein M406DRAFT_327969 [Cryphonectria parasitica EP155]KAF3766853.1 hypothetical protein M406DRAFT_327969 [Cryphonectria parasitica EP155]